MTVRPEDVLEGYGARSVAPYTSHMELPSTFFQIPSSVAEVYDSDVLHPAGSSQPLYPNSSRDAFDALSQGNETKKDGKALQRPLVFFCTSEVPALSSPGTYANYALEQARFKCEEIRTWLGIHELRWDLFHPHLGEELQTLYRVQLLNDKDEIEGLLLRATAAVREREYAYEIEKLVDEELHHRGLSPLEPLEAPQVLSFMRTGQHIAKAIQRWFSLQPAFNTLMPTIESVAARSECLCELNSRASSSTLQQLAALNTSLSEMSVKLASDTLMMGKNLDSMEARLRNLRQVVAQE